MAVSKSHLQELGEDFECDICYSTFEDPRVLICQHIYCAACLTKLVDGGSVVTCPGCRKETLLDLFKGVTGLPKPILLNKVQAKLSSLLDSPVKPEDANEKQVKHCGPCADVKVEKVAETYCKDCLCAMCKDCASKHEKLEGHDDHKLSDIKNHTNCDQHPMNINNMYCVDCKTALCWKCVIGKHKLHSVKELDEILPEQVKQLQQKADIIGKELKAVNAKLSENQNKDDLVGEALVDARKGVMKWCDDITAQIGAVVDKLLVELENKQDQMNKDLAADKTKLEETRESLVAQEKEVACTIDCGSVVEMLNFNREFKEPKCDFKSAVDTLELPILTSHHDIDFESTCELKWNIQGKSEASPPEKTTGDQSVSSALRTREDVSWREVLLGLFGDEPPRPSSQPPPSFLPGSNRRWTARQTYSHDAHNITDMIRHPSQDKFYVRVPKKSVPRAFSIVDVQSGSDRLVRIPDCYQWNYKESGLAFDSNRNIVVVGQYPRSLLLFDERGNFRRKVNIRGDIEDIERLVYCDNYGVYAVTDSALNCVHIVDDHTFAIIRSITSTGSDPFVHPQFISFDDSSGLLAVTDRQTRDIRMFDINGCEVRRIRDNGIMHRPNGLSFSPSGDLYVCNSESHYLGVVKVARGTDNTELCLDQGDLGSRSPYVLSMLSNTEMVVSGSPCMLSYFDYI